MTAMICQLQQIGRLQCDHRAVTTCILGEKNQKQSTKCFSQHLVEAESTEQNEQETWCVHLYYHSAADPEHCFQCDPSIFIT